MMRSVSGIFNDNDQCENFLHTTQKQDVFLVVSAGIGLDILNRIHQLPQLKAVVIFCGDKSKYESLINHWPKVRSVFTNIGVVCEFLLKRVFRQWDEELMDVSLISASDISGQKLDQLDQSFMCTQLIKEILFELKYNERNFEELIHFCNKRFARNPQQTSIIGDFQKEYRKHTPIWWYTVEWFLYHMFNGALRNQESNVIIKMRPFLYDLHQNIE